MPGSRLTFPDRQTGAAHRAILKWLEARFVTGEPVVLSRPLLRWLIEHLKRCGGPADAA